jgi:hypothetical protein
LTFTLDFIAYFSSTIACCYVISAYPIIKSTISKRESSSTFGASSLQSAHELYAQSSSDYTSINKRDSPELPPPIVDADLLIYLIALSAICLVPVDSFNYNLHMILDIRIIILLYTGMYRPANRTGLLRVKSFTFILFWNILSFIFYVISKHNLLLNSIGELCNMMVGLILWWEVYHHLYVRFPRHQQFVSINSSEEQTLESEENDNNV